MFGKREKSAMFIVNIIDNYLRDLIYYINWIFSKDLRNEMLKNKSLYNIHKGERCFIIGNGPSLKNYNLGKLTNEFVLTVNYMMKSEHYKILNPNFHLFFDPNFFNLNANNEDDQIKIQQINKAYKLKPQIKYFIPYQKRNQFINLFPNFKTFNLYNNKIYTTSIGKKIGLHQNIPIYQNVILYAINVAYYMGFSEIYLLGVDMTGFLEHFEYKKINEQWGHAYEDTDEDQRKNIQKIKESKFDNEFYLKAYGKTFEHFKLTRNILSQKKIRLLNASSYGALDVIPRVDFENLFENENY